MNRLLQRQIKRYFGDEENIPENLLPFLDAVNRSYNHYEEDLGLLERAMEISSDELMEANQRLSKESNNQKEIVEKLKTSIRTIFSMHFQEENKEVGADEDLVKIVDLLNRQLKKAKQYEEDLLLIKHFIDQSTDAIQVANLDGTFVFLNQRACNWLGDTHENLIGQLIYQMDEKVKSVGMWERLITELDNTKGPLLFRQLQHSESGRSFLIETSVAKVKIKEDYYIIGISRDVSERQKIEKEREKLIEKLKKVNAELENFAYVVSHDLKAPLRGIRSLTEWLIEDYSEQLDEEGQDLVLLLQKRVDRMYSLIDGILQYSRIGRRDTDTKSIDLNTILPEVIDFIAPPDNIKVTIETSMPSIENNETRIRQIFQNLISNSVKYNDKTEGVVKISCQPFESDHNFWQFCVEDNGPGIDEKYHTKVFQIFQTLQDKDTYQSTGIGLTIINKIIEINNGKIWLESSEGQGLKFYFTLPKVKPLV